ncbi:MAG: TniQ family protein [Aggregatilineales bacterium]
MVEHTTTLVCRPRPYPDESLLSYLLRVQFANHYDGLIWLTWWLRGLRHTPGSRSQFRPTATHETCFLENLATVTGVPVFDLYQMTLNRYAAIFTFPGRPTHYQMLHSGEQVAFCQQSHSLKSWSRTEARSAFCPLCLREAAYHRLPWLLHAIFACPKHDCWLLDTCSSCGASVSVETIVRSQCTRCSASLADMPVIPLDAMVADAQQHLMFCLETGNLPTETLPLLSVQALFRLVEGLCAATRQLGWEGEGCYQPEGVTRHPFPSHPQQSASPIQYGSLYTTAWRVVNDWPQGFYTFLDGYLRRPGGGNGTMKRSLGSFYDIWLEREWCHSDLEPVQTTFNDYFVTHFPPSHQILSLARVKRYPELRERMKWIDVRNAGRLLGVSATMISRMVRDGYVRAYYVNEASHDGRYFVYREDLESGLQQRTSPLTLNQVATEFLTTGKVVQEWMDTGLMSPTGSRLMRGEAHPSLTRHDVDRFLEQLADRACLQEQRPSHTMTLKMVCMRNNKIGMTSARVLQCVMEGKLQAFHTDPDLRPFSDLWFDLEEVATLTERIKAENNWLALREIPLFLHVDLKTVHLWIQNGLLIPVAHSSRSIYFDRTAVATLQKRFMRSAEVATLLETSDAALSSWVCAGYLPVLRGLDAGRGKAYLFDRDVVEQWRAQYITAGEAERLLGRTSYGVFRQRVRRGEYPLAHLEDMHTRFYHRADLKHFQSNLEQQL